MIAENTRAERIEDKGDEIVHKKIKRENDQQEENMEKSDMSVLKEDPEFLEYSEAIANASENKLFGISQEIRFKRRDVEVTKVMFGDNLLIFRNRVWLFSDKDIVYICDKCLQKYPDSISFGRHVENCDIQHMSGRCVYMDRAEDTAIYEIDGEYEDLLCQRLCIIGKAFIQRKTLHLDIGGHLFYILSISGRIVGFFSKEKNSETHNLSCLLILPPYQAKGYGSLLVDMSYILGSGSPEKPLSEDGQAVYKKYWKNKLLDLLQGLDGQRISICELSEKSKLSVDDVIHGLELIGINPEDPIYDVSKNPPPSSFRRCKYQCLLDF